MSVLIPGVYNYCDSWCERCRFQRRCRVFRDQQRLDAALGAGMTVETAVRMTYEDDDEVEPGPPMKASERLEVESFFKSLSDAASHSPTPEELREEERRRRLRKSDPLSVDSREYADLTHALLKLLRPIVEAGGDAIVLAAAETVERFGHTIFVKTLRAVGGQINVDGDDDEDEMREFSMSDGNGCAKLVRLLIGESRDAWEVLLHAGHGDGVPARMIERLERLDVGIAERFPRAMEFVRPGFDDASEG
jgi:hypothetical protein